MFLRLLLVMAVLVAVAGCAEQREQRRAASLVGPPLEVVDVELMGLNGRDGDPISILLLRPPSRNGLSSIEAARALLDEQGWRFVPAQIDGWWAWEGGRGTDGAVLGAAEKFIAQESPLAGDAPSMFTDAVAGSPGALVVLSVESG